jgi:hypothetical protein
VISVSAADFANLAWDTTGQSGSTVFAVRATDGTDFGDWTVLTVNTTDAPPIVAGFDPVPTATAAQPVIPATSIFEGSVPFGGDTITQYELWDPVAGDGQFVLAGAPQPARQVIDVAAADLADLSWDATDQTGRAVFAVRDFDGFVWSDWTVLAVDKVAQALAASATTPPSLGMGSLLGQGDTVSPTLAASIH